MLIVSQLTAGLVFNVWLGLGLWDYTSLFGNFLGQICLRYALIWRSLAALTAYLTEHDASWGFVLTSGLLYGEAALCFSQLKCSWPKPCFPEGHSWL